ncbi:MAG: hypothetical protein HRT40_13495 [Campylobacteraceae bacterium]|nr:hypothetical protein [Campylobacteraceae bacterium]
MKRSKHKTTQIQEILKDRESNFEPQLIKNSILYFFYDEKDLIISLYTKGKSTRDIKLHLDYLYGY